MNNYPLIELIIVNLYLKCANPLSVSPLQPEISNNLRKESFPNPLIILFGRTELAIYNFLREVSN